MGELVLTKEHVEKKVSELNEHLQKLFDQKAEIEAHINAFSGASQFGQQLLQELRELSVETPHE